MLTASQRFQLLGRQLSSSKYTILGPKIQKSIKMIREQPNVFFRVENDGSTLIGVVKSQTNNVLIYASYLRSDGSYGCQTQNLNSCGGLRGTVCKHILTLVSTAAHNKTIMKRFTKWIKNTQDLKPNNDRELGTYIFEQYEQRMNIQVLGVPMVAPSPRRHYRGIHHQDNFPIPSTIKIIDSLIEGEVEIQTDGNIQNKVDTIVCIGTRDKILYKNAENQNWKCCIGCSQWFSPDAQIAFEIGQECPSSMMGLAKSHTIAF